MENNRQQKIASVLQRDLADVLQSGAKNEGLYGVIISVSKVSVTVDLSAAKVHLSIFPTAKADAILKGIQTNSNLVKHEIAQRTKHQLRRMPQLEFFIDDSMDYIDKIEQSLKGGENPIEDPTLLKKRKKK